MITFFIKGALREASNFLSALKLFTLAESLGAVESLVRVSTCVFGGYMHMFDTVRNDATTQCAHLRAKAQESLNCARSGGEPGDHDPCECGPGASAGYRSL
jgi:hypothetical protein